MFLLQQGAQWINEGSPLCHLTCDDGSVYTVYGCIRGNLVEVNENLVSSPQLLVAKVSSLFSNCFQSLLNSSMPGQWWIQRGKSGHGPSYSVAIDFGPPSSQEINVRYWETY